MKIIVEPTPEMHTQELADGQKVPLRIWAGTTDMGIPIEAYIFAITPNDPASSPLLRETLPSFMKPAAQQYALVVPEETKE